MSKEDPKRARRLAEALRHNLRRRKAQARGEGLSQPTDGGSDSEGNHGNRPDED